MEYDPLDETASDLQRAVERVLDEAIRRGPDSQVELDDCCVRGPWPPFGDLAWMPLVQAVARAALERGRRFLIYLPLEPVPKLTRVRTVDDIPPVSQYEPASVYLMTESDPPRNWIGEYYRQDLPSPDPGLLCCVVLARRADEPDEEFSAEFWIEVRPRN